MVEYLPFFVFVALLLVLFVGVFASYLIFQLKSIYKDTTRRLEETENRLTELEDKNKPKRHTHATSAGLEDAIAIAIDTLREYEESKLYTEARIKQLNEILKMIRVGPYNYDENRPSGKRPKRGFDG
jgi:hypothetical protein